MDLVAQKHNGVAGVEQPVGGGAQARLELRPRQREGRGGAERRKSAGGPASGLGESVVVALLLRE